MNINITRIPLPVLQVASRLSGRALLVGGAVRDMVLDSLTPGGTEKIPQDYDLEVLGESYDQIVEELSDLNPKTVGKAFGIVKVSVGGIDIDINVPRTDNHVGIGHKGFECTFDPRMTVKEAARRRDFTINTLALDLATGEVVDEWGGLADLKAGILRATDPVLFVQDPLRALRAMQFLARFEFTLDPGTLLLIKGMVDVFPELSKERVGEEFKKLFLKAAKPSIGLNFLWESNLIDHFPEIKVLKGCPQNPEWHPEGDVWIHSCLAADAAAEIREFIPEHQREAFCYAVFLHDIGKPATTVLPEHIEQDLFPKERLYTAYGHDVAGRDPAETFLRRMTNNKKVIKLVRGIVGLHMQPYSLRVGNGKKGAYARLSKKMQDAGGDLQLIGRMCQCDACATSLEWQERSLRSGEPNWEHDTSERVMDWAVEFEKDDSAVEPKVQGRDLVAAGLKPGPDFGKILKKALELQYSDSGLSKEEILSQVLAA